ncbi:MAG: twin-arginine translocase TatA/TatE family subunit [Methyloligellaceae bacterium]
MYPGIWQILLIVVILVLLFGRGKISELMGDVAKGIKSFKKGISEEEAESDTVKSIDHSDAETAKHAKATAQEKTETS